VGLEPTKTPILVGIYYPKMFAETNLIYNRHRSFHVCENFDCGKVPQYNRMILFFILIKKKYFGCWIILELVSQIRRNFGSYLKLSPLFAILKLIKRLQYPNLNGVSYRFRLFFFK